MKNNKLREKNVEVCVRCIRLYFMGTYSLGTVKYGLF